jgi:hypothetical protein
MPDDEVVVLELAGDSARAICPNKLARHALTSLGFAGLDEQMVRPINDDADRKQLTTGLLALNAIFSGGPGWSPAELLGYYREQGIVTKPYRTIVWKGPRSFVISINT